jgi:hypothetical protein
LTYGRSTGHLINLEAGMSHYEVPTRIIISLYRMLLCVTFYIEGGVVTLLAY